MPRVCKVISTGEYINDFQRNPMPGTLIANAIKWGYDDEDLEEIEVSDSEYDAIVEQYFIDNPLPPDLTPGIRQSVRAKLSTLDFTKDEVDQMFGEGWGL